MTDTSNMEIDLVFPVHEGPLTPIISRRKSTRRSMLPNFVNDLVNRSSDHPINPVYVSTPIQQKPSTPTAPITTSPPQVKKARISIVDDSSPANPCQQQEPDLCEKYTTESRLWTKLVESSRAQVSTIPPTSTDLDWNATALGRDCLKSVGPLSQPNSQSQSYVDGCSRLKVVHQDLVFNLTRLADQLERQSLLTKVMERNLVSQSSDEFDRHSSPSFSLLFLDDL